MKRTIFFFVKIFNEKKYAEAMLDGELYINTLSFFQELEETEIANRNDAYEGINGWLQPDKVKITVNDYEIRSEDLASPVSFIMNSNKIINVFCLYAGHSGGAEIRTENEFKKQVCLSEENYKLGEHAVLVFNTKEFISRVKKAVEKNKYGMTAKLVDYYEPEVFHGTFNDKDAIFKKRKEFQHQCEYRFAIETGLTQNKAITLDIGSIKDIATVCDVREINEGIQFKVNEKSA